MTARKVKPKPVPREHKTRPKVRRDPVYLARWKALRVLGYRDYGTYLRSDLWGQIRAAVLAAEPLCRGCRRPARQVHHLSYALGVLKGTHRRSLVPVCRRCHELVEFDGRRKRSWAEMLRTARVMFRG